MTTYYLSGTTGQKGFSIADDSGVTEGTSSPTADCVVTFANAPNCSRSSMLRILDGIRNWIISDGINPAGPTIPFGSQ